MDTRELDLLIELRAGQASGRNRRVRKALRLSQEWVGEQIGAAAVTVCTYESGRRTPRGEIAVAYAKLLRELERRAIRAGIDLTGEDPDDDVTSVDASSVDVETAHSEVPNKTAVMLTGAPQ